MSKKYFKFDWIHKYFSLYKIENLRTKVYVAVQKKNKNKKKKHSFANFCTAGFQIDCNKYISKTIATNRMRHKVNFKRSTVSFYSFSSKLVSTNGFEEKLKQD